MTSFNPDLLEEMTPDEREDSIFDALVDVEVQVVDPELARWYKQAKQTNDFADRMRADIVYSDRVIAFRKAGQVTAADQLRAKANSLSHITDPKELWKCFADHQRDFAHKS